MKSLSFRALGPNFLIIISLAVLLVSYALATNIQRVAAQQPARQRQASATPPSPVPTVGNEDVVRITTNLVQVDVIITDKSGKPVPDLKVDEVQIFEDDRQQQITHFSMIEAENTPNKPTERVASVKKADVVPLPTTNLRPEQVRRTIALVVDDLGLSFESTAFVRRALKKFVDEQMQFGDLVAIIRTGAGIGALQQFTSDKRMLYAAIERIKWSFIGRSGVSPFAPLEDMSNLSDEARAANEEFDREREDIFSVGTLGAVNYVVKGLRELPGRKSVLLISDGFRIFQSGDPTHNFRAQEKLRHLIDEANRSAVAVYTMNATGLQTLSLTAADDTGGMDPGQVGEQLVKRRMAAFDNQEGLDVLARSTGGIAIKNTNDLSSGIKRVMSDQKLYYLIGYRPDKSTFDPRTGRRQFHHLKLKVTRPGKFNVRMRSGFYGVSDEENRVLANAPRDQIIRALTSPFGAAGVHVRLTSLFANDPKVGSYMRSLFHVAGSDLTFVDEPAGWKATTFDLVAVTFGDNGSVVGQISRTHTMRVKGSTYERILRDGFVYFMTVPVKNPGAYQLRAVLRDHGSERVGSASQFVEVPDIKKNRLSISGMLLASIDPATQKKDAPGTPASANSSVTSTPTVPPPDQPDDRVSATRSAAVRQFERGEVIEYGCVIYNARPEKPSNRPHLQVQIRLYQGSQLVFTGTLQDLNPIHVEDPKRIAFKGAIKLGADMVPGDYVLQAVVTDLAADKKHQTATQWMDFEIVK